MNILGVLISAGLLLATDTNELQGQLPGDLLPDLEVVDSYDSEETAVESRISRRKIEQNSAKSIADIVDEIAGVDNLGGPRKEAQTINIRGLQGGQVLQTIDGARQNFQMTHNAVTPVRFHLLESIEVKKGFQMDRGSGALGGHVEYQTVDGFRFHSGKSSSLKARAGSSSASRLTQYSLTGGQVWNSSNAILLDYSETKAEDVNLSNGQPLDYSGYSDTSHLVKYQHRKKSSDVELILDRFEKKSLTPFNPAAAAYSANQLADQIERKMAVNASYRSHQGLKPQIRVYANEMQMDKTRQTDGRVDRRQVLTTAVDARAEHNITGDSWGLRQQVGLELQRDINSGERDGGFLSSFPDGDSQSTGVFWDNHFVSGPNWIGVGARWDQSEFYSNGLPSMGTVGRIETQISPKLEYGRFFFNDQLEWQVGYNEGFNFPRMQYMFVDGLHFSDGFFFNNFFVPNLDLRSEHSQAYHMTFKWDYSALTGDPSMLEVTQYSNLVHDYIEQEIRIADDETQFVNREKTLFRGYELSNSNRLGKWNVNATYSQVRAEDIMKGSWLSQAPADRWSLGLGRQENDNWSWGVSSVWVGRQNRIDLSELANVPETPAYDLQNAFVRYSFVNGTDRGNVQMRVNNLMDVEYRPHGTPLEGPERDLRLDFSYQFM